VVDGGDVPAAGAERVGVPDAMPSGSPARPRGAAACRGRRLGGGPRRIGPTSVLAQRCGVVPPTGWSPPPSPLAVLPRSSRHPAFDPGVLVFEEPELGFLIGTGRVDDLIALLRVDDHDTAGSRRVGEYEECVRNAGRLVDPDLVPVSAHRAGPVLG